MPKWSLREAKMGDIIRVSIGKNMHHYGIYVSDSEVIQYGTGMDIFSKKEDVSIISTTIDDFINGKFLEVREYSVIEKLKKNSVAKTISLARARLGEAKYDILNNNCEHFVNECVFNKHESLEAEKYSENLK
ncbi:lecithin retinol acyltransferase family protein [Anaeroplasma bactoclasticum]|jgi:hypothetical protein|nr:lecithin retinol acyltransferase family protein [Anaeroplasma bactoclasticum]